MRPINMTFTSLSAPQTKDQPFFDQVMHRAISAYDTGRYDQAMRLVKQAQDIVELVIRGIPHPVERKQSVRAQLLGAFHIETDKGRSVKLCTHRKGQVLFKYLLQTPYVWQHKEHLMLVLFPEETSETARNRLHIAVSRLRSALGDAGFDSDTLHFEDDRYMLQLEVETDVMVVDELAQLGKTYEAQKDYSNAIRAYEKAVTLYRGEYLSDLTNEEWVLTERRHREQQYLYLLECLITFNLTIEDYPQAIHYCHTLLDHDNLREDVYVWLMLAQHRNGQRSRALKTFEDLRHILHVEFDAQPMPQTLELATKLREGTAI